jgi:hypothetical protein
MALITDTDLEKLATAVVDRFFNEKTALTEGVADAAEDANLNEEQTKRLTESVNNEAFLRKFNGEEDRLEGTEFEPANAHAAICRMLDAAKDLVGAVKKPGGMLTEDELMDDGGDLPTTRPEHEPLNPLEGEEVTASSEPKVRGHIVIMKLRKTAELLKEEENQARLALTDRFQRMATDFTKVGSAPFEEFEKDAFYKWGARAVPFLNLLRDSLAKPRAEYDAQAMTKTARVIDSTTPIMREFYHMMTASENVTRTRKAQEKVAQHLRQLECRN